MAGHESPGFPENETIHPGDTDTADKKTNFNSKSTILDKNRQNEGEDLLQEIMNDFTHNGSEIDWNRVYDIEDRYKVSWDEVREKFDGTIDLNANRAGENITNNDISSMTEELISSRLDYRDTQEFQEKVAIIKSGIFERGGYYYIGSFFSEGVIVENELHFYPSTGDAKHYGSEPIRVGSNTTLNDIGVQMLQGMQKYSARNPEFIPNWDLVSQIENTYGVNWDEVREM